MATPNYGYEKRQKELAKKKKEEKLKHKAERKVGEGGPDAPDVDVDTAEGAEAATDSGAPAAA